MKNQTLFFRLYLNFVVFSLIILVRRPRVTEQGTEGGGG